MSVVFLFLILLLPPAVLAESSSQSNETAGQDFAALREEEVQLKQKKVEELAHQIQKMHKDVQQERSDIKTSQEKIWKDFSDGLELERKNFKDRLEDIEQRQKLFERELAKKRQEDEVRLNEKAAELKRLMTQMDRLAAEAVEDQKVLEKEVKEAKRNEAAKAPPPEPDPGAEVLQNNALKIGRVQNGRDMVPVQDIGSQTDSGQANRAEYYVEIGDVLEVDVWRVPDVTRTVTVRPDGRISMPLVGDLDVLGVSLVEIKRILVERLSEYIRNPQVSLSVKQFGGRKFIILGEVSSPGVYRFQQDISLLEGIALAGGFRNDAKRGKIAIVRGDIHKEPQVKIISANLEKVLRKGMITENLTILPNDIIYVSKDFLGDYNDILDNLIKPAFDSSIDFFVLRNAVRISQQKRN